MADQAMVAAMTDGKPSTRKSRRHEAMGEDSPSWTMSQARVEAKEVANGAAIYSSDRRCFSGSA
jgi:hypothetical protein